MKAQRIQLKLAMILISKGQNGFTMRRRIIINNYVKWHLKGYSQKKGYEMEAKAETEADSGILYTYTTEDKE